MVHLINDDSLDSITYGIFVNLLVYIYLILKQTSERIRWKPVILIASREENWVVGEES